LGWPLPDVSKLSCFGSIAAAKNCITQFFGYTQFAASGAYAGKGHNGTDFRADVGTPVFAASNGVVADTGDTDAGCRGASYGKWILVKHTNNLSTIYSHLSQINVSPGDPVSRGTRIALSGKSGYATGPHLHFGLFATQGVSIQSIRSKVCGTLMTLPIAAVNAYLNPLDYL
ncbi:MAG: M23 family metallopeptidase, partial [Candidatus Sungbacteria bacterium]|nr:M23 family metallopeptidase [Candidatus Sungbacteria bacterium]